MLSSDAAPANPLSRVRGALIPLFIASGATSLAYETVWVREVHLVVGVSQLAVTTVLAAFMAGLALGAFAAGRFAGRLRRPLVAYAVLEVTIGLYALVFPWVLGAVTPVTLAFARASQPSPLLFGFLQFVVLGVVLLPPTICMGATLPVIANLVARSTGETGYWIGILYGTNTIGAVLGTALAGFYLLPRAGLAATTHWAVAGNVVVALAAVAMSRSAGVGPPEPAPSVKSAARTPQPGGPTVPATARVLVIIAALAGFAALSYELAWFRLMVLVLGGTAYAFSIMLLAFLLGIGLGGWFGAIGAERDWRLGGRDRVLRVLVWLEVGVALLAVVAMRVYGNLPILFVSLYNRVEPNFLWLLPAKLLIALGIMLPPALLMGAAFPYLVQAAAADPRALSRPVGRLYGYNTVGAIIGAALAGLVLLPALTMRGTILVAAGINIVAALLAALAVVRGKGRVWWAVGAGAFLAVLVVLTPPWNPLLMSAGTYINASLMAKEDRTRDGILEQSVRGNKLLYYKEGRSSVVTVAQQRGSDNIWLANNGKVDASSVEDLPTEVLLAHFPLLLHPEARRGLVIGYASGVTVGSAACYGSPRRIDVVELEPAVMEASRFFDSVNGRPLDDPRVHVYIDDGRHHLLETPDGTYDFVVSEPPNPWLSGVANLFTREFFELGRRKLAPGGVWSQWFHTYMMPDAAVKSLLATFAHVFPHVRVFRIDDADLVLVGSDSSLSLRASKLREVLAREPDARRDLQRVGVDGAEAVLSRFILGAETIRDLTRGAELNTDDDMLVEYAAPPYMYVTTEIANDAMLYAAAEIPIDAVEGKDAMQALAEAYAKSDPAPRRAMAVLRVAIEENPGDGKLKSLLRFYQIGMTPPEPGR